jgi:hypothetical protein
MQSCLKLYLLIEPLNAQHRQELDTMMQNRDNAVRKFISLHLYFIAELFQEPGWGGMARDRVRKCICVGFGLVAELFQEPRLDEMAPDRENIVRKCICLRFIPYI